MSIRCLFIERIDYLDSRKSQEVGVVAVHFGAGFQCQHGDMGIGGEIAAAAEYLQQMLQYR